MFLASVIPISLVLTRLVIYRRRKLKYTLTTNNFSILHSIPQFFFAVCRCHVSIKNNSNALSPENDVANLQSIDLFDYVQIY